MNSLSQNTSLLNTDPSHELAFFLSLLDAPFAPFMSSLDYASMMTNASSWFYSFLRKAFVSAIEKADLLFRTSPGRIQRFYVKQTRSRSIITIFGEITFKRTEYQRRDTKSLTAISTASFLFSLVSAMTAVLKRKLKKFMPTTIP